jgi:hypothetical protein
LELCSFRSPTLPARLRPFPMSVLGEPGASATGGYTTQRALSDLLPTIYIHLNQAVSFILHPSVKKRGEEQVFAKPRSEVLSW